MYTVSWEIADKLNNSDDTNDDRVRSIFYKIYTHMRVPCITGTFEIYKII